MTYKHDDVILYPMDLYFEGKKKINIHSMKPCVEEMDTPLGLFMAHIKIKQDSRMHLLCCWTCCNRQWHKCKAISYLGLKFMRQYLDRLEMFMICLASWHLKRYFINYDTAGIPITICLFASFSRLWLLLGTNGRKWKTDDLGQPSFLAIGNEKYM